MGGVLYLGLNMVCARIVKYPSERAFLGYNEIQASWQRYTLIDYEGIKDLLGFRVIPDFAEACKGWVEEPIKSDPMPPSCISLPKMLHSITIFSMKRYFD